ncbi:MAG: hypothetical protein HQ556_16200 [Candidatus Marinimicrobia bacterium]|nr:hypothetical protein [Candidatus Neomarinimicrobiota bacterium]
MELMKWASFIAILIIIQACENPEQDWVTISPIQCMENPWELSWLENHESDEWSNLSDEEQLDVFKKYYLDRGVPIFATRTSFPNEGSCRACSCPRGDQIHALVNSSDIHQMLDWGFSLD